jgi:paraquat-inducible protein B
MSKHASPTVIGTFVITAVALLLAGALIFGGGRYFHEEAHVIVYFEGSVAGLRVGAAVKFRGIDVGTVKDIRINVPGAVRDPKHIRIPVLLAIDEDRLKSEGVTEIDLRDPLQVNALVAEGLRAQLASESFVTGVMYVALDVRPDTPANLVGDRRYPEIPPVRGTMEGLSDKVDQVLTNLASIDFAELVSSARLLVQHTDELVRTPGLTRTLGHLDTLQAHLDHLILRLDATTAQLAPAINGLARASTSTSKMLAPEGHLATQIDATLRDLQLAVRSVKRLADQLSRDPGAILRGGRP